MMLAVLVQLLKTRRRLKECGEAADDLEAVTKTEATW
jgi:hypothetical protein